MNLNEYKGILVFAEQREGVLQNVGLELLGKAKELASQINEKVTAVVIGKNIKELSYTLAEYGADEILYVDDEKLEHYESEIYTQALKKVIDLKKPEIVLIGATTLGRDLAPRVSSRLDTGLTADCMVLEINKENGNLEMTRPAFGGNLMATIICPEHRPQMSTVRPGVMKKLEPIKNPIYILEEVKVNFDLSKVRVKLIEKVKEKRNTVDISEAKILISGGRGIGGKENFTKLEELAKKIKGEVAVSRGAVDMGIGSHDIQVGQTGKTVRPELYIACGISGAIQHVAGMEESDYIIAINKDKDAPIFSVADLGIVGDANKIVEELLERLK